jgi:hypothetical protein
MDITRPYFPNDTINVPELVYPRFSAEDVCDWNVKLSVDSDCVSAGVDALNIYLKADWKSVKFEKERETIEDGKGGKETSQVRVDPVYSFVTYVDEYILWYFYQIVYQSKKLIITLPSDTYIEGIEADVEHEEIHPGVHKVTISYKTADEYHTAYGLTGCCRPLYVEAPYESECDNNDGAIDNNVPPCDAVDFDISESGGTLTGNVTGAPGSTSISWYFRAKVTEAWSLLISGASTVSLGSYGIYRAILTATGCGQYIDQFLYTDPCVGFDVRIRQSGSGLVAELSSGYSGASYAWEFNDGTGWDALPDTVAAITALDSGDYRVTATVGDCSDSDVLTVVVNNCDLTASLSRTGDILGVLHTDCESPSYQWYKDNGMGVAIITGATSPTLTISETATYKVVVTCGDCNVEAQKLYFVTDNCDFTLSISRTGTILTATTDATSPSYAWELETNDGRTGIGTASTQAITEKGIYFLKVTSGACTKETYMYIEPSKTSVTCILSKSTGYEFAVYEIDMLEVIDPAIELQVFVNGSAQTYSSSVPGTTGLYSIKADGKIIFFSGSPLANAIIKIRYEAI